jgi:hypothetical protein
MPGLSFVTPLAYDYRLAFDAIGAYYSIADEIILGMDKDRISWSGKPYTIDEDELRKFLTASDADRKITFVEENFHALEKPLENDRLERTLLGERCKPGNWVLQIDSDEIIMNAADFRTWLLTTNPNGCVWLPLLNIFKRFDNRCLAIHPPMEWAAVGTMTRGHYKSGRDTLEPSIHAPYCLLHFTGARTPQEMRQKLTNWGHSKDFDTDAFFRFWDSLSLENYKQFKNFHPMHPHLWPELIEIQINRNQ